MATAQAAPSSDRVAVIDMKNMVKIWLEEKVARRELTLVEADEQLKEYEVNGKTWVGPFKDTAGDAKLIYKLAKDMKSWSGARVYFSRGLHGDLVTIKGWPKGRTLLPGTRYRVDNPRIVELQIGRPGLRAAARDSAKFGLILVCAVDVADFILRDKATLGQLLGNLTVDIPSVLVASAVGAIAGSMVVGSAVIGTIACGPFLVALVVGVAVGYGLAMADEHFGISEKLGEAYDRGLAKLDQARKQLGTAAEQRFHQLENSQMVHDLTQDAKEVARKIGRETDSIRWQLSRL